MIDAKQLRIGNIILLQTSQGDYDVHIIEKGNEIDDNSRLSYIPITRQILENAGFTKANFEGEEIDNLWKLGRYFSATEFPEVGIEVYCIGERVPAKYVHQLQNIYYAITGSELNLPVEKIKKSKL